jgi:hypothetical protein
MAVALSQEHGHLHAACFGDAANVVFEPRINMAFSARSFGSLTSSCSAALSASGDDAWPRARQRPDGHLPDRWASRSWRTRISNDTHHVEIKLSSNTCKGKDSASAVRGKERQWRLGVALLIALADLRKVTALKIAAWLTTAAM